MCETFDVELKTAIGRGEKVIPASPIHFLQWIAARDALIAALDVLMADVDPGSVESYIQKVRDKTVSNVVRVIYFHRIPCFKNGDFKLLVKVRVGSDAEKAWLCMKQHLLARKFQIMNGVAPRSKKERGLAKMFDDMS